MSEQLIAYLLGQLEADERAAVEARLQSDPELRRELERLRESLGLLAADAGPIEPPADLADRTCEYVESQADAAEELPMPAGWRGGAGRTWSRTDLTVSVGILLAASILGLPALSQTRADARLMSCQYNLKRLGGALTQFSERHQGYFPRVPPTGKLAAAGIYAPVLSDNEYLPDSSWVICPDSAQVDDFQPTIPAVKQIEAADGALLVRLYHTMGGNYAYPLGYIDAAGNPQPIKNLRRAWYALMADAPAADCARGANHRGCGQNVLCEDGHVSYWKHSYLVEGGDEIYVNDDHAIELGLHPDDAVLGSSWAQPHLTPIAH